MHIFRNLFEHKIVAEFIIALQKNNVKFSKILINLFEAFRENSRLN
jgi:hypothetical protein